MDDIQVDYPSMFELVADLNAMGEGNAINGIDGYIGKDILLAANAVYNSMYGSTDSQGQFSIPATFQVIFMVRVLPHIFANAKQIGWKPSESQPEPLARGSGKRSIKQELEGTATE